VARLSLVKSAPSAAMGIAGFQKWLVANFPDAAASVPPRASDSYAHVAFDMNQLCHMAARRATDAQTIAKLLFREIDSTLRTCIPTKSIFFAFDGPAPFAKLLTQRRRRAKEAARPPKLIRARARGGKWWRPPPLQSEGIRVSNSTARPRTHRLSLLIASRSHPEQSL
jgi:XRN 5'-3' exonuclease N-terminus